MRTRNKTYQWVNLSGDSTPIGDEPLVYWRGLGHLSQLEGCVHREFSTILHSPRVWSAQSQQDCVQYRGLVLVGWNICCNNGILHCMIQRALLRRELLVQTGKYHQPGKGAGGVSPSWWSAVDRIAPRHQEDYQSKFEDRSKVLWAVIIRESRSRERQTRYSSISWISGNHSSAPSSPVAFQIVDIPGSTRSWSWNTANCCKVRKCFPIRLFLYRIMYCACGGIVVSPSRQADCNQFAKTSSSTDSNQLFHVSYQTYLSFPSRYVWRISTGVSVWTSIPI